MTNDQFAGYDAEILKKSMIEKAKKVGADAIIFSDFSTEYDHKDGDRLALKAQLIKFL